MPCQPQGEVDIEVVVPLFREPTSQRRERTVPLIGYQYRDLDENDTNEPGRERVLAEPGSHRDSQNATGEERPRDRVHYFNRH